MAARREKPPRMEATHRPSVSWAQFIGLAVTLARLLAFGGIYAEQADALALDLDGVAINHLGEAGQVFGQRGEGPEKDQGGENSETSSAF